MQYKHFRHNINVVIKSNKPPLKFITMKKKNNVMPKGTDYILMSFNEFKQHITNQASVSRKSSNSSVLQSISKIDVTGKIY